MERRAYLSLLLASSAGCLARDEPRDTVRLVSSGDIPSRFGTEATVKVTNSRITLPRPARVRVTLWNTTDTPQEYGFDTNHPPINRVVGEAERGDRNLLLADAATVNRRLATCWRPTCRSRDHDHGGARIELASGEGIQNTLALWDIGPDATTCFPSGSYRFATGFGRGDETVEWAFTLRVESEE